MKLAKLPDRTPVKMNVLLAPGLAKRLRDYADFYAETYGSREEVAELIPFMLEAFLDADTDYRKARRKDDAPKGSHQSHKAGG
ncbi:DUF2274 domain-containing protein [Bradyrhizobium australiense]|uniref:DUF2274 domain-containing protein n=1 Tax=Bradyrhizobium australiense TaxID=2721161 RepID=A0A7Y4GSU4_9BRAD|nr:DUF2274 domain-containing protein [Bradyrhizobium australiense]NOJ41059.1 DUF2274 domain-containing protein [Bradyrhizobium australiense]